MEKTAYVVSNVNKINTSFIVKFVINCMSYYKSMKFTQKKKKNYSKSLNDIYNKLNLRLIYLH